MPHYNFDLDFPLGEEFEQQFLGIMSGGHIECKRDYLTHKWGNVFLEYESRGKPSGIATTEAMWWVFGICNKNGDVETIVMASTEWLKSAQKNPKYRHTSGGDEGSSMGVLIPVGEFANRGT